MFEIVLDVETTVEALKEPGLWKELVGRLPWRQIWILRESMRYGVLLVAELVQWWEW